MKIGNDYSTVTADQFLGGKPSSETKLRTRQKHHLPAAEVYVPGTQSAQVASDTRADPADTRRLCTHYATADHRTGCQSGSLGSPVGPCFPAGHMVPEQLTEPVSKKDEP